MEKHWRFSSLPSPDFTLNFTDNGQVINIKPLTLISCSNYPCSRITLSSEESGLTLPAGIKISLWTILAQFGFVILSSFILPVHGYSPPCMLIGLFRHACVSSTYPGEYNLHDPSVVRHTLGFHSVSVSETSQSVKTTLRWPTWRCTWWPTWRWTRWPT